MQCDVCGRVGGALMTRTASRKLPVTQGPGLASAAPGKRWNFRTWGTLADPIHKSHMSTLVGEFACTRQFSFDRQAELAHVERDRVAGKTAMGTAVHESIARALRNERFAANLLGGHVPTNRDTVREIVRAEFEREVAGRPISWKKGEDKFDVELDAAAEMVFGLFGDLHRHVRAVELAEAGFIAPLGDLFIEGHTDLVYRPHGEKLESLAFTDWKTGAQKPHQLQLDHGFEGGFYAHALKHGLFVPFELLGVWRDDAKRYAADPMLTCIDKPLPQHEWILLGGAHSEREAMHVALRACMRLRLDGRALPDGVRTFDQFPDMIRLTHLRDYVPYTKKGDKAAERPEDLLHWSRVLGHEVIRGEKVHYEKGMQRGGAWLKVGRREGDVARLERMLRSIVGWVRFGRFVEAVSEKCTRCTHREPCLTSGYELGREEMRDANAALAGLDLGTTDELSID